ncbi:DUF4148 domain-containing protein [Allopusillimonas ginsengisoli]|uniref:DUF4148 domain-containing protein n=1 Tax=Allopusillimonas ginsengisoli TaxID=453575 RepID=UPI0039C14D4A
MGVIIIMRISRMHLVAGFLLYGTVTAAGAQMHQPVQATQESNHSIADDYGEPKTRSEVRADLELWKRAGLDEFWRGESTPDTFSPRYKAAYAEYVRLLSGPEYQQEVERQSAM